MSPDDALCELLARLDSCNYRFVAVTPATHARIIARPRPSRLGLRDVFGWNRHFEAADIDPEMLDLLRRGQCLEQSGGRFRSKVRVASLGDRLFMHSSYPTDAPDSVFFGPDTYRFASLISDELTSVDPRWIVDMGTGTGAGGMIAAGHAPNARLTLVDINAEAARLARVNMSFAGLAAEMIISDRIPNGCDLILANPPYMIDAAGRTYRDGGGLFGGQTSFEWARQALNSLRPGGRLLLYTGVAIVAGEAPLLDYLGRLASDAGAWFTAREIDPDVFGEQLTEPGYSQVERIAAVGIKLVKA